MIPLAVQIWYCRNSCVLTMLGLRNSFGNVRNFSVFFYLQKITQGTNTMTYAKSFWSLRSWPLHFFIKCVIYRLRLGWYRCFSQNMGQFWLVCNLEKNVFQTLPFTLSDYWKFADRNEGINEINISGFTKFDVFYFRLAPKNSVKPDVLDSHLYTSISWR